MILIYSSFRLLLSVLLVLTRFGLWRANRRRVKAVNVELNPGSTMLEQMWSEHSRTTADRKIRTLEQRYLLLAALRDRIVSVQGRITPYALGSIDASLVWVADKLGYVQTAVETVSNLF